MFSRYFTNLPNLLLLEISFISSIDIPILPIPFSSTEIYIPIWWDLKALKDLKNVIAILFTFQYGEI